MPHSIIYQTSPLIVHKEAIVVQGISEQKIRENALERPGKPHTRDGVGNRPGLMQSRNRLEGTTGCLEQPRAASIAPVHKNLTDTHS
jgi:hypothetical protein